MNRNKIKTLIIALCGVLLSTSAYCTQKVGTLLKEPDNVLLEVLSKYQVVVDNFEYLSDEVGNDVWSVYDGTKPFEGDCEDFAFTMQAMVGAGSVYAVSSVLKRETTTIPDHAVFIYAGWVWELNGVVYNIDDYNKYIGTILWHLGDITPDLR